MAIALMVLAPVSAPAQWLNQKTAGLPRNADGTPNLTAPAPRTPDGKPDLSGIWQANGVKYLRDIAADLKPGDVPFQPWAEALFKERKDGASRVERVGRELPAARRSQDQRDARPVPDRADAGIRGDSL